MAGLLDNLLDVAQGSSNSAASNLSAPVDGLNWLLRKAGLPVSAAPMGGSDWMRSKGLTAEPKSQNYGLLGEALGGVAPMVAAAKAPQIASGLLSAGDAAAAGVGSMADHGMEMANRGLSNYMDSAGLKQYAVRDTNFGKTGFDPRYDTRKLEQPKLNALTTRVETLDHAEPANIDFRRYIDHPFIASMSDRSGTG